MDIINGSEHLTCISLIPSAELKVFLITGIPNTIVLSTKLQQLMDGPLH